VAQCEVETTYQKVGKGLSRSHVMECLHPHITLYERITPGLSQLTAIKMDHMYFWQQIHPVWNPLLKPIEATFLWGVIYTLYGDGQIEMAERIETILRTPHYDNQEVRELVALGALGSEFQEDEASRTSRHSMTNIGPFMHKRRPFINQQMTCSLIWRPDQMRTTNQRPWWNPLARLPPTDDLCAKPMLRLQ
jgi:hypothetical protein